MRRPTKSPFHLPREIRRADYTPSGYRIADGPEAESYTVTTPRGDKYTWRAYAGEDYGTTALPRYVRDECDRQHAADALLAILRPAKATPGREYDHEITRCDFAHLGDTLRAFGDWSGVRWQYADTTAPLESRAWVDFVPAEDVPCRSIYQYRAVEIHTTPTTYDYPKRAEIIVTQRHVSRSGMVRRLSLHSHDTRAWLTGYAARVLREKINPDDTISVTGCGMDMHFATVYNLAALLYGDGSALRARSLW